METEKSKEPTKKGNIFRKIFTEYRPILLFLPLIIMISSDDVTLVMNEILIVMDFKLETKLALFGALLGVSEIVKAIFTLSFGYMADKFQRKRLLIFAAMVWATADIFVGLSTSFVMLFVFRVISAAAAGAASSVSISLLADLFKSEDRGNSFAVWGAITAIGIGLGGLIATIFNKVDYTFDASATDFTSRIANLRGNSLEEVVRISWQMPFIIFGVVGWGCILLAMLLKEPKRAAKEKALRDVLVHEDVAYDKFYNIKFADLKKIYERKTNFWLIINFLDTVLTGLLVSSIILWITIEMGFDFTNPAIWGYMLCLLIPIGILSLWGMFYWPRRGDKMVKAGDSRGRVKIAIFCGWAHIPFLILGFLFMPDARELSFFKGTFQATPVTFALGLILMGLCVGGGLSLELAVGPCHYSSMIDVNLPEHRSTMIAAAAFIDSFGRAIGSWVGLLIADYYTNVLGSPKPISDAMLFSILTFGIGSGLMWFPIYKTSKKDFAEVEKILAQRKLELEQYHEKQAQMKKNDVHEQNS